MPAREQGLKALVRSLKDEAEMEAIADALEKTHWCRKDAARMLGISSEGCFTRFASSTDSSRPAPSKSQKMPRVEELDYSSAR